MSNTGVAIDDDDSVEGWREIMKANSVLGGIPEYFQSLDFRLTDQDNPREE